MSIVRKRRFWATFICGAALFQAGGNGCSDFYARAAIAGFDFCSVFNCSGGSFFDLCNPVALFADCPETTGA